jgi:hypothetical protein
MTPPDEPSPSSEQESQPIQTLQADNQRLRDVIVSLSAALLRSLALDPLSAARGTNSELLLLEAEECFRYARTVGLKRESIESLEAAGQGFMAKVVEIETILQRDKWKK